VIRAAIALSVLLVAVVIIVAVIVRPSSRTGPTPQPTPSSTPADPYAWYRSLPTATPGCPSTLTPELRKYFYRQCP
jgi:hypothetical protein